eukprot:scaffold26569_cov107-Isochrysis_galbana.AAC.8
MSPDTPKGLATLHALQALARTLVEHICPNGCHVYAFPADETCRTQQRDHRWVVSADRERKAAGSWSVGRRPVPPGLVLVW